VHPLEPSLPRCPICRGPIEPGDSVVFSVVFGERQAVHLRCADEGERTKADDPRWPADDRPHDQAS